MRLYKLIGGSHVQDGKTYHKNDVVPSEVPLDQMFKNKFEPMGSTNDIPVYNEPESQSEPDGEPTPDFSDAESELGTNVTSEFSEAIEKGVVVFKKASWYYAALPEKTNESLNEKGLTKKKLAEFLSDL